MVTARAGYKKKIENSNMKMRVNPDWVKTFPDLATVNRTFHSGDSDLFKFKTSWNFQRSAPIDRPNVAYLLGIRRDKKSL